MVRYVKIELKEYTVTEYLKSAKDIEDVCNDVLEYSGYIGDAIHDVADQSVEIYNAALWESAYDFKPWTEQAFEEGLISTSDPDFTLEHAFMAGQYEYYTEQLHENLDAIIFNYAANYYNDLNTEVELTAEQLEEALTDLDHNDLFAAIEDTVNELLDQ